MKRRLLSLFCALALCLGLLPATALADNGTLTYQYYDTVSGQMTEGTYTGEYTTVTSSDTDWGTSGQTTWYVVSDTVANYERSNITVSGTVNLILTSGKTLTLNGPNISLQNSSAVLNIYGQAGNTGKLSITPRYTSGDAGINLNGGTLNIHGGKVNATGYTNSATRSAPGIDVGGSGTLTVYGGEVTAEVGTSSNAGYGAGIRVVTGGTVNIHGGTVTATGASFVSTNDYPGAGIGGSGSGSNGETCGNVTITGGTVTANGGDGYQQHAAAGIGGGAGKSSSAGGGGNVIISGGTVTANGGKASRNDNVQAPGIGGAVYLSSSGGTGTFSTGTSGSAVITTTGGIQAGTSGCSAIIDNKVYGNVTLPDSLKTLNKDLTVPSGATLILPDGTTTRGAITVNGTLTVDSGSTVTNTGTITVESGGTLTGGGTINNNGSGTVTGDTGNVKVTYPSTVEVSSSTSGTAVLGQEVTFTATVTGNDTAGTPTGTVQFKDNGDDLGTAQTLNNEGKATYTAANGLDIGEHTITAEYNGDTTYTGNSGTLTFTVVGDVARISVQTQPTKMEYETGNTLDLTGLEITVHYVGSTYTQNIAWVANSGITASPANGTALYASQHNGKPVTITYEGKTATTNDLTVSKADQTGFAFTEESPKEVDYSPNGTFTVKAEGGEGTGAVTYTVTNGMDVISIDGNTATILKAGTATITATKAEDGDYNEATATLTVTVSKADPTVTAPMPVTGLTYTGEEQELITAGATTGGTLVYSLTGDEDDYSTAIPTGIDAKTYTVYYKVQGNANYNDTEAQSVTAVIGNALAEVTILPTANTLTYTGSAQALVTAGEADGGEIQYSLSKDSGYSDTVPTATNAGDYSVWYYVKGDENHSDTQPVEVKVTIAKATPSVTDVAASNPSTIYDTTDISAITLTHGDSDTPGTVTLTAGQTLHAGSGTYNWTFTPTDTANYNNATGTITLTVVADTLEKIEVTTEPTKTTYTYGDSFDKSGMVVTATYASGKTKDVTNEVVITPDELTVGMSALTITFGGKETTLNITVSPAVISIASATVADKTYDGKTDATVESVTFSDDVQLTADDYTATATLTDASANDNQSATVKVTLQNGNYTFANSEKTATANATAKISPLAVALSWSTPTSFTYDGEEHSVTAEVTNKVGEDTFTLTYDNNAKTDAGSYTATVTGLGNDNYTLTGASGTEQAWSVTKATPTGTPKYTAITTSGKTLADAGLTTEGGTFSVRGTVAWEQADTTQVQANTAYTWKFTPTDSDNYNSISGSITLYVVSSSGGGGGSSGGGGGSSGGGSSSSGNKTETTTNPDGSTTTTVTSSNGTVTETTKNPDGSQNVVETKKDGTVTTTTTDTTGNKTEVVENTDGTKETTITNKDGSSSATTVDETGKTQAEVKLPAAVVEDAQGEAVTLPMPEVPITTDRETAPTVTVDLPSGTSAKVEIPVAEVTPGTVAVIVKADGTEEVIKTSLTTENGVAVTLSDGGTVKIVNNSKSFDDVSATYWGAEAVDFTSSRELFAGTSATTFAPDTAMTRAMIVTVLARFEGVDTTTGDTWYEAGQQWAMQNGVSDGSNMDASLTREQLVTMFYRYAQSKGYDTTQGGMAIREYADFEQISDYAVEAMTWAVNTGIINGTSTTTLSPQGEATRAQVATILMRFIEGMA